MQRTAHVIRSQNLPKERPSWSAHACITCNAHSISYAYWQGRITEFVLASQASGAALTSPLPPK
jgi:hypothetical protein